MVDVSKMALCYFTYFRSLSNTIGIAKQGTNDLKTLKICLASFDDHYSKILHNYLKTTDDQIQYKGYNSKKVNKVHWLFEEGPFFGRAHESY